jgi:spoIIIJ-associated protein
VAATLQRLLTLSGIELVARSIATDEGTSLEVDGADLKLVTQKDSELLFALQFLLNRMAPRSWPDAGHIHLVCHSERRQRDEELVVMARQKAQEVLRTGEPCTLAPMNAYERRLVHLAVREFDTLTSHSEGDGMVKCVEIAPRD